MYLHALAGHNLLRWIVLLVGLIALTLRWRSVWKERDTPIIRIITTIFVVLLDVQILVGSAVYLSSPLRAGAFENPSGAFVSDAGFVMFFHPALMLIATAVAHASNVVAKRDFNPALRRQAVALLLTASFVVMALAIPWWRPFFRPL